MSGNELAFVQDAFDTNWLTTLGPNVEAFEQEFVEHTGGFGVALSSGTAALHLALRLTGVGPGDVVVCPTLTFVASVNPVVYLGAEPVLVDSERQSWNLDPNVLEDALKRLDGKRRPKALLLVHLFGQSADLRPIMEIADRFGVVVIEDAAEALGATYEDRPVGSFGAVAAFSFNGNKIITTTGGGMLVTPRRDWAEKARFWASQARDPAVAYEHSELGYNYRMSNVLAGIGRGQLRVLNERIAQRRAVAFRYKAALEELGGLSLMPQAPWGLHTNWLSCFLVEEAAFGASRDDIIRVLAEREIEARPVWKPMHQQPLYRHARAFGGAVADDLFARGLCLPSSSFLTSDDQDRVIEGVRASRQRSVRSAPATGGVHETTTA